MPTEAMEGAPVEGTTAQASTVPFADTLQGGLGQTVVQMGGAVVLVVALILVLQRIAKRYRIGWGSGSRDAGIEILSQRALGNRLSLLVVETQGQAFLLGTSPQGVQPLATLGPSATKTTTSGTSVALASGGRAEGTPAPAVRPAPNRAHGAFRSMARAVSRRSAEAPRSALADLEEAARIAEMTRAREGAGTETVGELLDLQGFETEFREKLRVIRETYLTLEEAEGGRA